MLVVAMARFDQRDLLVAFDQCLIGTMSTTPAATLIARALGAALCGGLRRLADAVCDDERDAGGWRSPAVTMLFVDVVVCCFKKVVN